MKRPRRRSAVRRRQAGKIDGSPIGDIRLADVRLYELFTGFALAGILAAQGTEPNNAWVRRQALRIGCDTAAHTARLRGKGK